MSTKQRLLPLILLLLLSSAGTAQTHRASLRGTVTDPNKAVMPGSSVKVVNQETNEERNTVSDDLGRYAL